MPLTGRWRVRAATVPPEFAAPFSRGKEGVNRSVIFLGRIIIKRRGCAMNRFVGQFAVLLVLGALMLASVQPSDGAPQLESELVIQTTGGAFASNHRTALPRTSFRAPSVPSKKLAPRYRTRESAS